jgi:hypothetical protein
MSTPSGELPSSTQIVGQQTEPSTVVPHTPGLAQPNNNLALVSLITGILSFAGHIIPLVGGSTLAIVAVVTGYMARNQIKETGEQGRTMATVGMILGIVNLAIVGVVVILLILFIFVLGIGIFGIAARNG